MTIRPERVREFIEFSRDKSKKQNGFVYVGRGNPNNHLVVELGLSNFELYQLFPISKKMDEGKNAGNGSSLDYYITEAKWNEIFWEPVKEEKPESLESRIAAAQTYLGKDIESTSVNGRHGDVKKVRVVLDSKEAIEEFRCPRSYAEKHFKNGPEVILQGDWSNGDNMLRVFDLSNPPKIYVEKIKVNGFDAEDKGEHYEFGCAAIQKSQLQRAKEFLIETNKGLSGYCNRKTESVKIGAGDFTLEILNKLNL